MSDVRGNLGWPVRIRNHRSTFCRFPGFHAALSLYQRDPCDFFLLHSFRYMCVLLLQMGCADGHKNSNKPPKMIVIHRASVQPIRVPSLGMLDDDLYNMYGIHVVGIMYIRVCVGRTPQNYQVYIYHTVYTVYTCVRIMYILYSSHFRCRIINLPNPRRSLTVGTCNHELQLFCSRCVLLLMIILTFSFFRVYIDTPSVNSK